MPGFMQVDLYRVDPYLKHQCIEALGEKRDENCGSSRTVI